MTDWIRVADAQCPLDVGSVTWADPVFVMSGPEWAFTSMSSWRLRQEFLIVGFDDPLASDALNGLAGKQIVAIKTPNSALGDLEFVFSDATSLDVFVTGPIDPWVLRLPAGPTLVPAPGGPEQS